MSASRRLFAAPMPIQQPRKIDVAGKNAACRRAISDCNVGECPAAPPPAIESGAQCPGVASVCCYLTPVQLPIPPATACLMPLTGSYRIADSCPPPTAQSKAGCRCARERGRSAAVTPRRREASITGVGVEAIEHLRADVGTTPARAGTGTRSRPVGARGRDQPAVNPSSPATNREPLSREVNRRAATPDTKSLRNRR